MTVSWKASAPSWGPAVATRNRCRSVACSSSSVWKGGSRLTTGYNATAARRVRCPGERTAPRLLEGGEQLLGGVLGADLRPRLGDGAVGVDQVGRADHPHVLAAVHALLAPGGV